MAGAVLQRPQAMAWAGDPLRQARRRLPRWGSSCAPSRSGYANKETRPSRHRGLPAPEGPTHRRSSHAAMRTHGRCPCDLVGDQRFGDDQCGVGASVATYCVHHRDIKRSLGVAMTLPALAGCSSSGGGGQTSCALALEYEGRTYYSLKPAKPVKGLTPWRPKFDSPFAMTAEDKTSPEPPRRKTLLRASRP
jgi:hypothetical protein